ncbi:hypothetical protein OH492_28660 [Vibrio chagasii]|nr:hypothetical protein [Vibrio chagasii]
MVYAAEAWTKQRIADGIPRVETPVAEPIKHGERILNEAIEEVAKRQRVQNAPVATDDKPKKPATRKTELKQALLSGISYAVPSRIVAGGTVFAVAVLIAEIFDPRAELLRNKRFLAVDVVVN